MESWLSFVTTPWISFVSKSESICEAEELDKVRAKQCVYTTFHAFTFMCY